MAEYRLSPSDRRMLLAAVGSGNVYVTDKGAIVRRSRGTQNYRCDRGIRALEAEGVVLLDAGKTYRLAHQGDLDGQG